MKHLEVIILLCVPNNLVNGYLQWDTERVPAFDLELYQEVLNPELCEEQLVYIAQDALLRSKFLDAGIRTPRGILDLNLVDLGNYHQCLGIHDEHTSIQGKYCSIDIPLLQDKLNLSSIPGLLPNGMELTDGTMRKLRDMEAWKAYVETLSGSTSNKMTRTDIDSSVLSSVSLTVATCIPESCTTQQALDTLLFNITSIGLKFTEGFCRLPNDKPLVTADYVAFALFGLLGLLTLASTAYDVHHSVILKKDPKSISKLYQSFSFYTNCRRLVTYTSTPKTIECLDGLRVLAMMWIILGHVYSTYMRTPLLNPIYINEQGLWEYICATMWYIECTWSRYSVFLYSPESWLKSRHSVLIAAAPISVDTFFMLSGVLIVYTTAGKLKSIQLLKNIHLFYLNRLLRMFPILATCVLLMASWFNHVADGPIWSPITRKVHNCRTFWWSTLLHVQNYINPSYICLGHTWYLAVDIQLHLLSPLILFWVLTSKKAAWVSLTSALVMSLTAATIFNAMHGFSAAVIDPTGDNIEYMQKYYMNTLTRASPFFVGMLFGYLLFTTKERKIRMSTTLISLFWILWAGLMASVIYVAYPLQQPDWDNKMLDILINSYMRPAWAVGLGWMIFACAQGYGGPLNWLLSLKMWKLPSRLSFAMYIFHYPLLIMMNATSVSSVYIADAPLLFRFFADFSLTVFVAFLVTLLVDAPFSTLIKMAMGGGAKSPKHKEPQGKVNKTTSDGIIINGYICSHEGKTRL